MTAGSGVRELELEGRRWRAIEAWRGRGGRGLCYFAPLEDGALVEDDRADRRASLEPGEEVASLDRGRLESLWSEAAPLTATEQRIRDIEGRPWLAQSSGPVWAEADTAAGLTGLVFTSLDGTGERLEVSGGTPTAWSDEELRERLRVTRSHAGSPSDGDV